MATAMWHCVACHITNNYNLNTPEANEPAKFRMHLHDGLAAKKQSRALSAGADFGRGPTAREATQLSWTTAIFESQHHGLNA